MTMTVEQMLRLMHCGKQFSFRRFMNTALYATDGYYNRHVRIGGDGADFYTAAQFPLFAYTLANAIVAAWKRLGSKEMLQVVELGAGQGELAHALGNRLRKVLPHDVAIQYVIVEKAQELALFQQSRLNGDEKSRDIRFKRIWEEPDETLCTVVIGNEVLDALPVERLRRTKRGYERGYVALESNERILEVWNRAPARLKEAAERYLPIPFGHKAEFCPSYKSFFQKCRRFGKSMELILIDYGISKFELCDGIRIDGTIRGYHEHQIKSPLLMPGEMDITADVQWHLVMEALSRVGFQEMSLVTQKEFLLNHEALAVFEEMKKQVQSMSPIEDLKLSGQLKQLVFPGGFGERFQVLTASLRRT